jgi:hypothetical protein
VADPLRKCAAVVFAADLAADRVSSIRAIRAALQVGQPRAQRLREYLAAVAQAHGENPGGVRGKTSAHCRRPHTESAVWRTRQLLLERKVLCVAMPAVTRHRWVGRSGRRV